MTSVQRSTNVLAAGWKALASGDWGAAYEFFAAAVEGGDDPESFEGLAWAAWWRNDAETLFRAREHAYQLYRRQGDSVGAARAALWLGCDYHDFRGDHAVGAGWHRRARRHLEGQPPNPEQGWLAFQEGAYALELADDTRTAHERADEVAVLARTLAEPDLEFLSLALKGLALVTEGAAVEGMALLDEASVAVTSGEYRERIAATWTLCYLMYACERVRDIDRTTQWCRRMEKLASRFDFDLGVGVCRAHYGGILVLTGDWARAERQLVEAGRDLERVRPPAAGEATSRLGELRRRQGRVVEAVGLFEQAGQHPLALLGRAALAADLGHHDEAAEILEDLLFVIPEGSVTQRVDALALMVRVRVVSGDLAGAEVTATRLDEIVATLGTSAMTALATWTRGVVLGGRGQTDGARRHLEQAAGLFERAGMPYESACARLDLARALNAAGRAQAAAAHAARATISLRELGAELSGHHALAPPPSDVGSARDPEALRVLTPREREVLGLIGLGLSDREIAERLVISPHTVHRHVSSILTKLALRSRSAAAALAGRHMLPAPEPHG